MWAEKIERGPNLCHSNKFTDVASDPKILYRDRFSSVIYVEIPGRFFSHMLLLNYIFPPSYTGGAIFRLKGYVQVLPIKYNFNRLVYQITFSPLINSPDEFYWSPHYFLNVPK